MTDPVVAPSLQLSARAALAAGIAVGAAEALRLPFPIYALIAAVIVTDVSAARTRALVPPRIVGTLLGALVGALSSQLLPATTLVACLGVFVAMFLTCLLRMESAARLAGYLAALILLGYRDSPWQYGMYRVLETLLGIAAAMLVSFVPPQLRSGPIASTGATQ